MNEPSHTLGGGTSTHTTGVTLQEILALCAAIKVPCSTPPAPAPAPATPPRRSQRLLKRPLSPTAVVPTATRTKPNPKPGVQVPKGGSTRARRSALHPCKLCKGKEKAGPAPPVQVRLAMTSKFRYTEGEVSHLSMGFAYLADEQDAEGRTVIVLTLGTDTVAAELMGLDRMEVDVRLGFAAV